MRRVNIQAAFLGEGGDSDTGDEEGLALSVRGGEIVLVLPAGTSEEKAVHAASTLRGSLRLESGRVLTFEIHDGAVGAFFEDEPAELFDRREESPADGTHPLCRRPARTRMSSPTSARTIDTTSSRRLPATWSGSRTPAPTT